jgi:hypothetical protein
MTDPIDDQAEVFSTTIIALAFLMLEDRRNFFLQWLSAHDTRLTCRDRAQPESIHKSLLTWFGAMPREEALQEYERVVREIVWWRELQPETLAEMLKG